MSEAIRRLKPNIQLTRNVIIGIIILSFVGFIIVSSWGGSITNSLDSTENAPTYEDDPRSIDLPKQGEGGFNISEIGDPPEGLNPPADLIENANGIGGQFPDLSPPENPNQGPGNEFPQFPDRPDDPQQPQNPGGGFGGFPDAPNPDLPDRPPQGSSNQGNGSFINFPDNPNKAAYLWNLSSIELFPNTNSSFSINFNFPKINMPEYNNLIFLGVILGILYLPQLVITRLQEELGHDFKNKEEQSDNSIFFKPNKTELEVQKEQERKRLLSSLSDQIDQLIVRVIQQKDQGKIPKEIITRSYLELDEAFASFLTLKRDKDLTPLEHARISFESHEIDNEALTTIVDLFYQTRFGNKELGSDAIDKLVQNLEKLVISENSGKTGNESRWRFF